MGPQSFGVGSVGRTFGVGQNLVVGGVVQKNGMGKCHAIYAYSKENTASYMYNMI